MKDSIDIFTKDLEETIKGVKTFQSNTLLTNTYSIMLILFIVALLPMPYEFYISLRTLVCVGIGIFFYSLTKNNEQDLTVYKYALIGLVVLYNPLYMIPLGDKLVWTFVNTITLYILFTLRTKLEPKRPTSDPEE